MWKLGFVVLAVMVAVEVAAVPVQDQDACDIQGPGLKFCLASLSVPVPPHQTLSFTLINGTMGTAQTPPQPEYAVLNVFLVGTQGHRPVVLAEKDDIMIPAGVPVPETLVNVSNTPGTVVVLVGREGQTSSTAAITVP